MLGAYLPDSTRATIEAALRALSGSRDNAQVRVTKHKTAGGWMFEVEFINEGPPSQERT
jgi:hypothetical protein